MGVRIRRWFGALRLKKKIVLIVALTFSAVFLFCFFVFGVSYAYTVSQNTENNLQNACIQKENELDAYLKRLDSIAYSIMFSNWAQSLLQPSAAWSLSERQMNQQNASHFLSNLSAVNDGIHFIILSCDGTVVHNNTNLTLIPYLDLTRSPWYDQLIEQGKYQDYGNAGNLYLNVTDPSLNLYYAVTNYRDFSLLGYLIISTPQKKFSFLVENLAQGQAMLVTDREGAIVVSSRSQAEVSGGLPIAGGQRTWIGNYQAVERPIGDQGWTIWALLPANAQWDTYAGRLLSILWLVIPLGAFFMLLALWFSRYLTAPILRCKDAILEVRDNHFGVRIENGYRDEIGELIDGFNDMSHAIEHLVSQNDMFYLLGREAEFNALQQKINPHFLYNTLEIINGLILSGHERQAVSVCETLGQMFRYNLDDRKWVQLREECDYIRQYLMITQYRIEGITTIWEVDETALDTPVFRLLLQPIVENSVKHGFHNKAQECCLTIRIRDAGQEIKIVVMDNGSGLTPNQMQELTASLKVGQPSPGQKGARSHIGIRNISRRLSLEYQDRAQLRMTSREGAGMKTEIILPKDGPDGDAGGQSGKEKT